METSKNHSLKRARAPSPDTELHHPIKHRRLDDESQSISLKSSPKSPHSDSTSFSLLSEWPDDIIIHLLQFLEFESLRSLHKTCKRLHLIVQFNLKRFVGSVSASIPFSDEIQYLLQARAQFCPTPPRNSFGYIDLMRSIYTDFETIANTANPVKKCPREVIHPDLDFDFLRPSHTHFFRTSYCYYFSHPMQPIANFWTIFWEYKRIKREDPENFQEKVAKWAWERYTYKEILGVARFNGSYYSRIITSSLNCQRDALKMVLEIYQSRDARHEVWSFNNGEIPKDHFDDTGVPSLHWHRSLSRNSESEYRTGQVPPGIERHGPFDLN